MVKIRLMRVGKRKQPSYRVVVADSRSPRDGRIIEAIGHYQPRNEPSVVEIDNERALHWLRRGAQASDPVRKLLAISGAWTEFTGEPAPGMPPPKERKATAAASVEQVAEEETPDTEAVPEEDQGAGSGEAGVAEAASSESPEAPAAPAEPVTEEGAGTER